MKANVLKEEDIFKSFHGWVNKKNNRFDEKMIGELLLVDDLFEKVFNLKNDIVKSLNKKNKNNLVFLIFILSWMRLFYIKEFRKIKSSNNVVLVNKNNIGNKCCVELIDGKCYMFHNVSQLRGNARTIYDIFIKYKILNSNMELK